MRKTIKKLAVGCALITGVALAPQSASANSKYAAIVVDGNTGKVLHASHADAPRYPASLTKIMTLYVLFDYLKKKRLDKSTKFYVTPHAAAQAPSKLGLKAGSHIKVRDIIGALVTKSANDAAAVAAENIAGSVKRFALLMTKKARAIGMKNTTFKNASGLPNRLQKTTARDMAMLSMRIMNDFPKLSKAFKTKYYRYGRRNYRNHNRLLFNYRGTEGIKTGYTRASGFNLTTSVKHGRKHIIAVVMGGRTGGRRNRQMVRLLDRYFPRAIASRTKRSLAQRVASLNPHAAGTVPHTASTKTATSWTKSKELAKASPRKATYKKAHSVGKYAGASPLAGAYDIQIGAYETRDQAIGKLDNAKIKAASLLQGHKAYIMQFSKGGINYHRARFAGFSSRNGARNVCSRLKKKLDTGCIVMQP